MSFKKIFPGDVFNHVLILQMFLICDRRVGGMGNQEHSVLYKTVTGEMIKRWHSEINFGQGTIVSTRSYYRKESAASLPRDP